MLKRILSTMFTLLLMLPLPACAQEITGDDAVDLVSNQLSTISDSVIISEYEDVPSDAWYGEAVQYLQEHGIVSGMTATAFSPNTPMARSMLADALYKLEDSPKVSTAPDFTDIEASAPYYDAVSWAASAGVISGYGNGTFGANDSVTREQMATILWRCAGSPECDTTEAFSDTASISTWAIQAVTWAKETAIITGRGNNHFAPKDTITRAEASVMLFHYVKQEQQNIQPGELGKAPTVTLNSGYEMPVLGLGTWTQSDETAENSVYVALKDGYRLIDTARYYGNEAGVGAGIRRAIEEGIVTREEVFVTSKIMPSSYRDPDTAIDESNSNLGLDYIDLMLIHQPGSNDKEVYKALERAVADGKVRSIGISNYYTAAAFDRVIQDAEIMPAVVQNENHLYYQNTELQEYVSQYGTLVESYYPFGGRGHTQDLFNDTTIVKIAAAHKKTSAQVILRWHIQAGFIAIPGSSNPDHILENISIFDFQLSDEEMQLIAELNLGRRYENW